jgi:hypothetical protein
MLISSGYSFRPFGVDRDRRCLGEACWFSSELCLFYFMHAMILEKPSQDAGVGFGGVLSM